MGVKKINKFDFENFQQSLVIVQCFRKLRKCLRLWNFTKFGIISKWFMFNYRPHKNSRRDQIPKLSREKCTVANRLDASELQFTACIM